ncbi:MAG TPA: DUF3810 family protein [Vicinamibacterales bacterium]|nr:DUF3810 family protein [Vicinamibacterales bacterium]
MPPRRTELTRRGTLRLAIVIVAVAAAILPLSSRFIERWYSNGFYLIVQTHLTPVTNLIPVALLDLAVTVLILGFVRRAVRSRGGRPLALMRDAAGRLTVFAALLYLVFLIIWGLNYRRQPLVQKLEFDSSRVTRNSAVALAEEAVSRVNGLHAAAHAQSGEGVSLQQAFADAQRALGQRRVAAVGVPKRSLLAWYFRWAAIDGMTDPFFLEIIINPDALPIERPFVVAHEWAHLAGYADESEANFVAWLTCVRGDEQARYSGWLVLHQHVLGALPHDDRRALVARLEPGPRADLSAIDARYRRAAPVVRQAARDVYDSYLKANRVPEGIASYDAVVRLVLGTTFDNGWAPRVRMSP